MTTYALVENPGMDNEKTVRDGLLYKEAMRMIQQRYCVDEIEAGFVQIMRELPDGSLTTEF